MVEARAPQNPTAFSVIETNLWLFDNVEDYTKELVLHIVFKRFTLKSILLNVCRKYMKEFRNQYLD